MEKSKIPSLLKTPVTQLPGNAANALQPAESKVNAFNKFPPARRILSRRSKSFSDLRSAKITKEQLLMKPVRKYGIAESLKKVSSNTDVSSIAKKNPLIKPRLDTISEKPKRVGVVANLKSTVKRPAATASSEDNVKPKVAKPMKPAPYDFKARFQLLSEKHTALQQTSKNDKVRIEELESGLKEFNTLKADFENLQQRHEIVEEENRRFKLTEIELNQLKETHKLQQDRCSELEKTKHELSSRIGELEAIKADLDNELGRTKLDLEGLRINHKKLQQDYSKQQSDYNAALSNNTYLENELKNANEKIKELEDSLCTYKSAVQSHEESRRVMHNQIQDLKGTIRVFCRVRPSLPVEEFKMLCYINCSDEATLEIKKCKESINCISGRPADLKQEFIFDKVFPPEATQMEIFEELSQLIQSALDGYHVCVFAYGQTGSGKTYTMQGDPSKDTTMGMIPRTVRLIFDLIQSLQKLGWKYTVQVNFLEIYNETIKDLLDPNDKGQHEIYFNEGRGITVTNMTTKTVKSDEELIYLMNMANSNRAVAATNYNEHSSRSHAVTKIILGGLHEEMGTQYVGSLSLVDLAGSESAKNSSSERITETKNINKSLSTLGTVMCALHNKEPHIPYRNSKLTYLLQSCLGGNSKTLMIVNIAPFDECYNESINALRFASTVKEVKIGSRKNKTYLKREISNVTSR